MKCRRISSLGELHLKTAAAVSAPAAEDPKLRRVVEVLGKLEKRGRPRKRRTLSQCISAMFQKKIHQQEVDHLISAMLANGLISEAHNTITYEF